MIPHNMVRDMAHAGFSAESVTRVTGILLDVCENAGPPKRWLMFPESGYISAEWIRGGRTVMVTIGKSPDSNPVVRCLDVPAFPCGSGVDPIAALAKMGQWLAAGPSDEEYEKGFELSCSHVSRGVTE